MSTPEDDQRIHIILSIIPALIGMLMVMILAVTMACATYIAYAHSNADKTESTP